MGNICILAKDPEKWITDSIKNAFNQARIDDPKKKWLVYGNVKLIKEFAKDNPSDDEIKDGMSSMDESILIISEISYATDNIISETSRAIKAGKPTIVITQSKKKARALIKRAKNIIDYDPESEDKRDVLKNDLVKCFKKIYIETVGKDWEYLIGKINVPIYTLDSKGNIDYVNPAALEFFNLTEDKIKNKTPVEFMANFKKKKKKKGEVEEAYAARVLDKYENIFNDQEDQIRNAIDAGQEDILFNPVLFKVKSGVSQYVKLCHLRVYSGGDKGSMCIFWNIDKHDGGKMGKLLASALTDLTDAD